MQLNGTNGPIIMAASEPPEPPPRNPDKINASLKQITDSKSSKSLDACERTENNNKPFKSILSLDNSKTATMGTKETDIVGHNATVTVTNDNGKKLNALITVAATIPSPTAVQNTRTSPHQDHSGINTTMILSPKGGRSPAAATAADELMNGSNGTGGGGSSGKSTNSSPNATGSGGSGLSETITKNRSPTDGVRNLNINNNQDNGNANDETGKIKIGDKSPSYDGKVGGRNDSIRGRRPMDGDNNVNVENGGDAQQNQRLRMENERLKSEINRLRSILENSPDGAVGGIDISDSNSIGASSTDGAGGAALGPERLEIELKAAKQQIANLRLERRKLKADKGDLLAHVKQLCASLQDKEQELRDFIRNFEQRMRDTETNVSKVSSERERERWSLLKHAREEAERSIALAAQLNTRDMQLKRVQEQLQEARRQLSGCMSDQESVLSFAPLTPPSGLMNHLNPSASAYGPVGMASLSAGDRGSCSADSGVRGSSDRESAAGDLNLSDGPCDNGPCITIDSDSISLVSSHHMYNYGGTPKERSPTLSPLNAGAFNRSIDNGALSRSVEHLGSPVDSEGAHQSYLMHQQIVQRRIPSIKSGTLGGRSSNRASGGGGTWGSISRVFARSRNRNKQHAAQLDNDDTGAYQPQWSPLTEEGYAEKLRLLREASAMPIERWRASQVLAWIEVALGMPQYSSRCAENVKSGKVLLELNDGELESGLGLTHPMHRKKIRLAIEEQRRPDLVRYPTIGQLGHTWVASEWLPDIGLPQYAEAFLHSLVDARMLDTLSKKELEKFLNVTRKFHQASIVHGIHVLRILKYDRQSLAMRRMHCENNDSDPIVWTNQRFIRWARSIDLGEYAENLKDSGVHGGLVVLEPSFSGETMATALGIPQSKNIIRRHLCTEFDALILPARATLGQGIRSGGSVVPITGPGGLQSQTTDRRANGSLRGSLSKAFGFNTTKSKRNDKSLGNSTSPTPSYSSLSSENGLYATVGIIPPPLPCNGPPTHLPHNQNYQHSAYAMAGGSIAGISGSNSPPPLPSHRVSAPPMDTNSTLPRYAQHRRVKSISDIEALAGTP